MKIIQAMLAGVLLAASTAAAEMPKTINFQGRLTDSGGSPVADANYSVSIRIYDSETAPVGNHLWSDTFDIETKNGYFEVALGSQVPFPETGPMAMDFDQQYFVGIKVGMDSEMTPRQPLRAVPYARRAFITNAAVTAQSATISATALHANNADNATYAQDSNALDGYDHSQFIKKNSSAVGPSDVADGAVDTQAKAPWAPNVILNGTPVSNPKIACGTVWTDSDGWADINISSLGFTVTPIVTANCVEGDANSTIITVVDSTTKDNLRFRSWYEFGNDHSNGGPRLINWIAIGY